MTNDEGTKAGRQQTVSYYRWKGRNGVASVNLAKNQSTELTARIKGEESQRSDVLGFSDCFSRKRRWM